MSFSALSAKTNAISGPYKTRIAESDQFWDGSVFDWIRRLPSRTRGSIGQQLAISIFENYGYPVGKRKDSFEVNGSIVISRSSMLWEEDHWKFQQIRNKPFDFLFCLGLYPDSASAWLVPKSELYLSDGSLLERDGWTHQHGGKSGKEDAWLDVYPDNQPQWLGNFGGDVSKIEQVFAKFLPKT